MSLKMLTRLLMILIITTNTDTSNCPDFARVEVELATGIKNILRQACLLSQVMFYPCAKFYRNSFALKAWKDTKSDIVSTMLFAKLAWDKTTAYVLMNEILLTKLLYLTEAYPDLKIHPEAQDILTKLDTTYHDNLDLLDFITDKLQEKDRSQSSTLTEEEEHASQIRDIINQIYKDTDTS